MNHWQATFLGLKHLPRELSGFEIEAFFTFTASERALIEARRGRPRWYQYAGRIPLPHRAIR
jgi:hypothetical protein